MCEHCAEVRIVSTFSLYGSRAVLTWGKLRRSDLKTSKVSAWPRKKWKAQRSMSAFWCEKRQGQLGLRTSVAFQRDLAVVPERAGPMTETCAARRAPRHFSGQAPGEPRPLCLCPASLPTSSLSVLRPSAWLPYQSSVEIKPGSTTSKILWYNSSHKHVT